MSYFRCSKENNKHSDTGKWNQMTLNGGYGKEKKTYIWQQAAGWGFFIC